MYTEKIDKHIKIFIDVLLLTNSKNTSYISMQYDFDTVLYWAQSECWHL